MNKLDNDFPPLVRTPRLDSELDKLQTLLDSLTLVYKVKKDAQVNSTSPSNAGQKQRHRSLLHTTFSDG